MHYLILALVDALKSIHSSGVIHRDIKPENILVQRLMGVKEGYYNIKIADFGYAIQLADRHSNTWPVGSPGYAAPQAFVQEHSIYGTEADVFSLGVTLYTIVAKKSPYKDVCVDGRPILAYCYGTPPKYKKKRFEMHVPKGDNCQDHECEHSPANLIGKMLEENPED